MNQRIKHRNTHQRQIILDELSKLKTHPSAAELYEIVRRKVPNISLGTIYRNLEFLSESGQIKKLTLTGEQARFDGDISSHLHVRCDVCGRVDDFEYEVGDPVAESPNKLRGYKINGCRMEFYGICPDCLKKNKG